MIAHVVQSRNNNLLVINLVSNIMLSRCGVIISADLSSIHRVLHDIRGVLRVLNFNNDTYR